ncbi:MAG: DHH family phosphoesterase [Candidatus Omnitrophota bacterium]
MSVKKVLAEVKRYRRFLICAHINLEGDALGSELALARLLRKLGKKAYVVNQDPAPKLYEFLPDMGSILKPRKGLDFDAVITVDCSDFERIGSVKHLLSKTTPIINIDHHVGNSRFGTVNWIDAAASSVSEMIYVLYKKAGVRVDREAARLLYTGILVDTGSFRFENTSARTHAVVAELMDFYPLPVRELYSLVYGRLPLEEVKCLIKLAAGFSVDRSKKIIWITLRRGALNEKAMKTDVSDYLFDFLRSIDGIEVALIFREIDKNQVRVNLRSQGRVNVAKVAQRFSGGGHANASGCTINTGLATAQELVLKEIRKRL